MLFSQHTVDYRQNLIDFFLVPRPTSPKPSSSAVAERPRDALCPLVVSFHSVIPRAQSFIIVT